MEIKVNLEQGACCILIGESEYKLAENINIFTLNGRALLKCLLEAAYISGYRDSIKDTMLQVKIPIDEK